MFPRPLLVVGVLLLGGLAGCIGADDEPVAPQGTDDNSSKGNITTEMPDGRDGRISAFDETNRTEDGVGGAAHDHDYWKGRERVVVMETHAMMHPRPNTEGASATFRVPAPGLVFEGTGKVEFTVGNFQRHACEWVVTFPYDYICTPEFASPVEPDGLTLQFKHAATNEWQTAGSVTAGSTLEIAIPDPRWTDMPHATASLWIFRVVSPNPQDVTLTFDAQATIVRSGDVPEWPGHPDFYGEKPWRKVCNMCTGTTRDAGISRAVARDAVFPNEEQLVVPEKLVSHGTNTLRVWVNITGFEGNVDPDSWYLEWHNATGQWRYTEPDVSPFGENGYEFVLPVKPDGMDTPYADGSRWEFGFYGVYGNCVGGCVNYAVTYNVDMLATNEVLAEDQYTPFNG